jgi:hypothetical protein
MQGAAWGPSFDLSCANLDQRLKACDEDLDQHFNFYNEAISCR